MAIVAAIDRSERATNVIKEASVLAEAFDETLHVTHVLSQSEFIDLERTSVDDSGKPLDMDQVRTVAQNIAEEMVIDLNISVETVGLVGRPAIQIIDYANKQNARYIVVGPRKRSPAGKAVFGSTSQSILLNADCPVLMIIDKD